MHPVWVGPHSDFADFLDRRLSNSKFVESRTVNGVRTCVFRHVIRQSGDETESYERIDEFVVSIDEYELMEWNSIEGNPPIERVRRLLLDFDTPIDPVTFHSDPRTAPPPSE